MASAKGGWRLLLALRHRFAAGIAEFVHRVTRPRATAISLSASCRSISRRADPQIPMRMDSCSIEAPFSAAQGVSGYIDVCAGYLLGKGLGIRNCRRRCSGTDFGIRTERSQTKCVGARNSGRRSEPG